MIESPKSEMSSRIEQQIAYVNNLFTGLSTGILTFLVHLAFNGDFTFSGLSDKVIILSSTTLTFMSLSFGVYLSWLRIEHYRMQSRHKSLSEEEDKKHNLTNLIRSERKNRKFLKYQAITLVLAAAFLVVLAVLAFLRKPVVL